MTEQEEREFIIREFLSRIEDPTGTVRRYSKTLLNKPSWVTEEIKEIPWAKEVNNDEN